MPALYMFRANPILFFGLLFVVYYCYGTQLSVYASTSADFYGTKNVGFNYGLLLLAWGVGAGFLGGMIANEIHDLLRGVAGGGACYSSCAISLAALCALLFAKSPHAAKCDGTSTGGNQHFEFVEAATVGSLTGEPLSRGRIQEKGRRLRRPKIAASPGAKVGSDQVTITSRLSRGLSHL